MEPRLSLITIGARDLSRLVSFYKDGLGWPVAWEKPGEVCFFRLRNIVFSVYPKEKLAEDVGIDIAGAGSPGITLAYNVGSPEEADAILSEVKAAGAEIVKPAEKAFWGGYSGYFADPEGNLWEVAHNPAWPLDERGNVVIPE